MKPGRIVLDARCIRRTPGGVVAYTEALIAHLPALLPDVAIILLRHQDAPYPLSRASNVAHWNLNGDPNGVWNYFRLGRWLRARLEPDDVFHAPYRILPRNIQTKTIITIHDVMQVVCPELVFPNRFIRAFVAPYWSFAIRSSLRRADRVLAVSQHSANDTLRVDASCASRLRVTLNGKSPSFRHIERETAERATSSIVPIGQRFFLVVGGGYPNKNHVAAVSAFAKAFRDSENIWLLVVERRRPFPPELRRLVRRLRIDNRIQIRSSVEAEELIALYSRAEALVFPSLYEGFGLPVLEAMACGCPVLCSNVTSLPEVTGDAALYFKPEDKDEIANAMRQVLEDQNLRITLSERGVRRAALFNWRKMAVETIQAYREIAPWIPAPRLTP
jgi:glycosyltransferase involved in cell wall biosynthesis